MNQTLKVSAFLCLCFALTNANIFDGLHGKKPTVMNHEKAANNKEKKPETITVVNTNNKRVKRQIPFGFGMDTSFMDYAAYDYYDWVCSGGTCQLCDVLTGACCVPNRNNNCFLPDSCANNPCLSGGTCITTRTVAGQPDFVCVCQRGLTGKYCQLIDEFTPPIMAPLPIPIGAAPVPVPGGAAVPPPAGGAVAPAGGPGGPGGAPAPAGGAAAPLGAGAPSGNRMMGMSSFTSGVPASAQTNAMSSATGMMGGLGGLGGMGGMGGMGAGMGGLGGMGNMMGMGGMGGMGGMMGMGGAAGAATPQAAAAGGMGAMGGMGNMMGMGGMGNMMGGMGAGMGGMGAGMGGLGGMGNMMGMGGMGAAGAQGAQQANMMG